MAILKIRDSEGNVQEILTIKGSDYILTEADKKEIADMVIATQTSEAWIFTLENGSTVTKNVVIE